MAAGIRYLLIFYVMQDRQRSKDAPTSQIIFFSRAYSLPLLRIQIISWVAEITDPGVVTLF